MRIIGIKCESLARMVTREFMVSPLNRLRLILIANLFLIARQNEVIGSFGIQLCHLATRPAWSKAIAMNGGRPPTSLSSKGCKD